jgi:hypothetical protein
MKSRTYIICYEDRGIANSCYYGKVEYKRIGDAFKKLNKLNGNSVLFEILDSDEYVERMTEMVESVNLMSGKKIMIPKIHKGTVCDPATESYWSA